MTYKDNSREGIAGAPEPVDPRFEPVAPERFSPPATEPLVAAVPPPAAPAAEPPLDPTLTHPEASWRNLVGPRSADFGSTSDAASIREENAVIDRQAVLAADSINPALQAPAVAAVALPAADAVELSEALRQAPARRESAITFSRIGEELFAWFKTLASAAVYATLIVTFGFQVARVEGQSMAPTLENQDRLIVNKLAYRLGDPQVGDIVMLYYPLNPDKSFVKRIIAEENDTIRIVDGRVYRNDVLINDDYVPPEFRSNDDWGPEVVPTGYYFVMGDHRNNSSDSRHWKFVPKKYIIGKVQLRWWPLPHARLF